MNQTDKVRADFEAEYPVPDGVIWSDGHQCYWNKSSTEEATKRQNYLWQGYQSSRPAVQGEAVATLRLSWHERQDSGHYEYWTGLDCMDSREDIEAYNALCQKLGPGEHKLFISPPATQPSFQSRVAVWMQKCFGQVISADTVERNHRFLEEALELVQACGCSHSEAHQLVDYVFGRPVGEMHQEVGGVQVTLAALCEAQGLDMHRDGETELERINDPVTVEKIRAKQAAKPKHSPLPQQMASMDELKKDAERYRKMRNWYLQGLPRSDIFEHGHICITTPEIVDNGIDAMEVPNDH